MAAPLRFLRLSPLAVCVVALATTARAELLTGSEPIVQRYVEATGGADALAAQKSVRVKGRIHSSGLSGTWEMVWAPPDRWVRRYRLGPLRFREGFDGQVAWNTDYSDKAVTILSAAEARHARDEGWFLNERWALPDQDGGRVRLRSTAYRTDVTLDMVEITSPSGAQRVLSVDRKTGLPERVTGKVDQRPFEERPTKWKKLAGRKRWTLDEAPRFINDDRPIERVTLDSAWVNERIDSTRFSPPRLPGRAIAWKSGRDSVRATMTYESKTVMVRVSINGAEPEDFILDTGAGITFLDTDYAHQIGLKLEGQGRVQGIAAGGGMQFARVATIAVQGRGARAATLKDFKVGVLDITKGAKILTWRKPAGVLGADFLSHFAVELDYDRRLVSFYDPAKFQYAGTGATMPMELFDGIPVVDLTLNDGCGGKFIVDVGNAFHFTVHGVLVRSCGMLSTLKRKEIEVIGGGVGGAFAGTLCRLDSVRIGPFAWSEPVAALTLHTRGMIGSSDIAGNVGNTMLERFRVTFDYANHRFHLDPGTAFGEREHVSRFGALFAKVGLKVYAGNVLTGSAAYEAGLRWYDEIVAVDGKPLEKWSREEIDRLLEAGPIGAVHTITYKRLDDEEKTVEVKLKDVL